MRPGEEHEVRPFLKVRRAYIDVLHAGHRKNLIHGLLEFDVTEAHGLLHSGGSGPAPSFTAWLVHCVAAAVNADRSVQAYRQRNRLMLFADVDVNTKIEVDLHGQKAVKSVIVRAAHRESVQQITDEIRRAQREEPGDERRYRGTIAYANLPGFVRRLGWRAVLANPRWFKRFGGTVGLSSVGMFGSGGGWGIVMSPPTLMVVAGGISTQPRFVDGQPRDRELLSVTLSFDHDVVDGAPAVRFAARLGTLLEQAYGLDATGNGRS